jgi:hypothetical protein
MVQNGDFRVATEFEFRLNCVFGNVINLTFYPAEAFVVVLAFNRMITFVSDRVTYKLFGGKRVYVSCSRIMIMQQLFEDLFKSSKLIKIVVKVSFCQFRISKSVLQFWIAGGWLYGCVWTVHN